MSLHAHDRRTGRPGRSWSLVVVVRVVRVIQQSTVGVVERLGRYQRTLGPGVHLLVPMLDRMPGGGRHEGDGAGVPAAARDHPGQRHDRGRHDRLLPGHRRGPKATYEVANMLLAMEQLTDHHAAKRGRVDDARGDADQPRPDQHAAARRARRGHREVGRARDPRRAEEHRPAAHDPGGDGAADARRPGQARRHPAGRGREAVGDPPRRGPAPGGDPERRGRPAGQRAARRGREAGAGAAGRRARRRRSRRSSTPSARDRDRPRRHARLQVPRGAARGRGRRREQAAPAAQRARPTRWAPWPASERPSARAPRRRRDKEPPRKPRVADPAGARAAAE